MSDYRLYLGDCLEFMRGMDAGSVDAVITDPPYGVGLGNTSGSGGAHGLSRGGYASYDDTYENFVKRIVPRLTVSIEIAKRAAVFTGPHIHEQKKPDVIGGVYCPSGSGRHSWGFKFFLPVLYYGTAPELNKGISIPNVIKSGATAEDNGHPCPKPIEWMRWLVALCTREGDTVFDPFMGSGTTGVACMQLGRNFIGCEIDPTYYAIAERRIKDAAAQPALFTLDAPKIEYRQAELV